MASQDQKNAFKLGQIYKCMISKRNIKMFEKILEKEGDINYAIQLGTHGLTSEYNSRNTALHFAYQMECLVMFNKLLDIGADFTKRNDEGETVLHKMVLNPTMINRPLDKPYINAVLSAHINTNNFSNPYDKQGFSHFHIACMTTNVTAVKFFLDNGVSVDDPVHLDTIYLPGCTPLHLAAMCTNTKVAELLLAYGANMHTADASGMTVLHVLIKCRMEVLDSISETLRKENDSCKQLQHQIKENEMMMNMLMENMSSDNDCVDHIGLSNFHIACMLQDASAAQHLIDRVTDLDHSLNADSKLWPGYTALHFAAHVNLDIVELLVKEGANFVKQNSAGITPLDICIERYKIEDVCRIMSLNADWIDITLSDGRTNLISFLRTFATRNEFKRLTDRPNYDIMNMFVPMESPLWPGFTPLHLAVRFAEKSKQMFKEDEKGVDFQIIRLCLKNGSDLSAQDSRGRTAFHLAYRLEKMKVVDLILHQSREIPNAFDEDNLSHLHIICAVSKTMKMFRKCVIDDSNVNAVYRGTSPILDVRPGSTPLHICLVYGYCDEFHVPKMKELLKYSVDPNIKDAYGLTPIHWLLNTDSPYEKKINPLLKLVANDCVAEEYGLSYLHVAVHLKDTKVAKRLLKSGADVNSVIRFTEQIKKNPLFYLSRYDKNRPLSMTSAYEATDLANLLINRGADVYSEIVSTSAWSTPKNSVLKVLWNSTELQTRIRQEFGWTRLHLACYAFPILDIQLESIVRAELADVNAKIHPNSTIWKGYTPLHLLMKRGGLDKVYPASEILLENGADVTMTDDKQTTPITMMFNYTPYEPVPKLAALLIKYHRNFNVNPVNSLGISHFHVACYLGDVDVVREFLSHGVDVNHPIGYFANWSPGFTPLHLASNVQIVDLLINHGANVNIEDVNGHTALYTAVLSDAFDEDIIKRLIEGGADVNRTNYRGKTAFEVALSRGPITMDRLTFFIRQGFFVNSCNPITRVGYIAIARCTFYQDRNLHQAILETIMNENPTSSLGRTTLHYLVTKESSIELRDYAILIEKVIKSGCDIDDQDNDGKTALHLAVISRHISALKALLMCGADINVLDELGNSALCYTPNRFTSKTPGSNIAADILSIHAGRLAFFKLDLSHKIKAVASEALRYFQDYAISQDFSQQIVTVKAIELGVRSMRLSDFLSETGAVAAYRLLTELERSEIDKYFESIHDDDRLKEITSFLKLQYRKAIKRSELYSSAICSFVSLLGFDLPYLCAENIFQNLRNSDLQNIISARIENEDTEMDVD